MKIAVTGATGQIGRLVMEKLLENQPAENIVAVVRNQEKASDLAARGVEVRVATYDEPGALRAALHSVEKLLLISSNEMGRRIQQHTNVIDAAKAAGVRHVVYMSAPKATITSLILAPEHKATEEYLVASGLEYTIVRNNWYTENYLRQLPVVQQTGVLVAAAGQGRVASATRADYAAGATAVLVGRGHEGKVYEFGGDYAWNYDELAAAMSEVIGRAVVYQPVDGATLIEILRGAGMDEGTAGFVAALDANIAEGALAETTGDLSRLIGRPTTGLAAGLKAGE